MQITPPGSIGSYTNSYNSSGQVVSQSDPVTNDTTTFTYGTGSGNLATTTVTVGGNGTAPESTEYDYWSNVLADEVTGVGSGTPGTEKMTRSQSVLLPTSKTDPDSNISRDSYSTSGPMSAADVVQTTDGMGNISQDLYNAYNQVWCSMDAADYANLVANGGVTSAKLLQNLNNVIPSSIPSQLYPGLALSIYNNSDQLIATIDPLEQHHDLRLHIRCLRHSERALVLHDRSGELQAVAPEQMSWLRVEHLFRDDEHLQRSGVSADLD